MDAVTLLKRDHQKLEKLFQRYLAAPPHSAARRGLVEKITTELSVHAAVEEQLLYPTMRDQDPRLGDLALDALEQHHLAKVLLAEIAGLRDGDERLEAKVRVLIRLVREHIREEEDEALPQLAADVGKDELDALGLMLSEAKRFAPTRPHPAAPDRPPLNLVAGDLSAILDRGRDLLVNAGRRLARLWVAEARRLPDIAERSIAGARRLPRQLAAYSRKLRR